VTATPFAAGPLAEMRVSDLIESLAARTAAPASGSAAGITLALAAALCTMAARFSERSLDGATGLAERAERLGERALRLAEEDALAYAAVLRARRLPTDGDGAERETSLRLAMDGAIAVPVEMAEIGGEIGLIATKLASEGNPNLLGDALAAMLLAEAAASVASTLAEINVGDDHQVRSGQEAGSGHG